MANLSIPFNDTIISMDEYDTAENHFVLIALLHKNKRRAFFANGSRRNIDELRCRFRLIWSPGRIRWSGDTIGRLNEGIDIERFAGMQLVLQGEIVDMFTDSLYSVSAGLKGDSPVASGSRYLGFLMDPE
jgi:hypothetical protein